MRAKTHAPRIPHATGLGIADQMVSFKLYFASGAYSSEQALLNLNRICQQYYKGRYSIEKIDILREPLRALSEGVLLTPTLVRISPEPQRTIVGDLNNTAMVLNILGIHPPHVVPD